MYRPEAQIANSEINQGLDNLFQTPVQQQLGDAALAYGAEQKRMDSLTRQQISDGQLPDVQIHDSAAGKFSDAPPKAPLLDEEGRVQFINYADGTSRLFTYKDGHVDTYKDRDGHTWKFTSPDIWTQQDGKSVLHGEMIVDKDGSFTFINHDKNYVSHYGADGKENLSARKKYDEYTNEEFLALETAGKQFAATGLPQESVEKKKENSNSSSVEEPSDPAVGEGGQSPERPGAGGPDSPHPEEPGDSAEKPKPETSGEVTPVSETKPETNEAEKPKPETSGDVTPVSETKPETSEAEKPKPETSGEVTPVSETKPEAGEAEKPKPEEPAVVAAQDSAVIPLTAEQVQAFARNFQLDASAVARIGALTLEQVRAEMQAIPALERVNSQKYRFYDEMVYRLTDGKTTSEYSSSNLT